jgi:hypothetical protein
VWQIYTHPSILNLYDGTKELFELTQVHDLKRLYGDLLEHYPESYTIQQFLEHKAQLLLRLHAERQPAVYFQIGSWYPKSRVSSFEEALSLEFTLEDAKLTIAREHGFKDWKAVTDLGDMEFDHQFEHAATAIVTGDIEKLRELLRQSPDLIRRVSRYGHRSTLLHYVAANGVESWRQTVPPNAVEITRLLVEAGADIDAKADVYGGLHDTMSLLVTSSHPYEAGLTQPIADQLKRGMAQPNSKA